MSNVLRTTGLILISFILFTLVILGAGAIAMFQGESRFPEIFSPTSTITSTLRIIHLESNSAVDNTSTPEPTGTKFATDQTNVETTFTATTTNTMTPTTTWFSVECQPPSGWVLYTVKSGDNLYRIGLKFRIDTFTLQKANCMGTSTTIITGQKLWVPNVPTSTPEHTATTKPQATQPKATAQPTATPTITSTQSNNTPTLTPSPTATYTPTPTEITSEPTKSEP